MSKIVILLKLECRLNWNGAKIGMLLKLECRLNWTEWKEKTDYIEKVVNLETSNTASIGKISMFLCVCFFYHEWSSEIKAHMSLQ